uniref:Putative secreted protein n=1 Tax=Anopheles darlingi TaxID=43151 RepID=A0A2M4DB69_ANODA
MIRSTLASRFSLLSLLSLSLSLRPDHNWSDDAPSQRTNVFGRHLMVCRRHTLYAHPLDWGKGKNMGGRKCF